jgi:predicted DNA-binding protein (UPF0251 family)
MLESRPPINHKQIPQELHTLTQSDISPKINVKRDVLKRPLISAYPKFVIVVNKG